MLFRSLHLVLAWTALLLIGAVTIWLMFPVDVHRWTRGVPILPLILTIGLGSYAFMITVPALLDRSISIHLIGALNASPAGLSEAQLQARFLSGYVDGTSQVDKRIDEQLREGNIEFRNGRFRLTAKGQLVAKINIVLAELLSIDPRYVRGTE